MADKFNLAIIGAGTGGYVAAIRAAQLGMKVALIERAKVGGTCLHIGCIPTKALLRSAELLHEFKSGREFGITTNGIEFDYAQAAKRKDQVVDRLYKGVQGLMKKNKITVLKGTGRFLEPKKIEVSGGDGDPVVIEADNVIIATGSAPRSLPGLEPDGKQIVTSDDVLNFTGYPKSVIILGSGAVGSEFASMYADFGTDVTLVELLPRIVPLEDPEISTELERGFKRRKIKVLTGTKADPSSMKKTPEGIAIKVANDKGEQTLDAEVLLVAVGRKTVTEGLNLEATGVQLDRGIIQVDGYCRTAEPGVYAIGDVIGGYWLAHAAAHEGITAVEHMAGEDPLPVDQDLIPRATYCRPEIASFGLTEEQARERGHEVKVGSFPFRAIGKALIQGDTEGFVKMVADAQTGLLLGVHAIGPHVTDLIAEGVFARLVEGTPQELAMSVHPHPTLSEVFGEAAMAVDGRAIHF